MEGKTFLLITKCSEMMKKQGIALLLMLWLSGAITAQDRFELQNPSFERGRAECCTVPEGWMNMGSTKESPPDVQPGSFGVDMEAQDGEQYLGLVVRDNDTWEGIGQKLDGFLKKDSSYTFSLYLNRSNIYKSLSRLTQKEANFNSPTILKIWGVNVETQQEELLAESNAVSHSQWTRYTFTLTPRTGDFDEIDLMAYYAKGYERKNGNLLIDNCSAIEKIKQ